MAPKEVDFLSCSETRPTSGSPHAIGRNVGSNDLLDERDRSPSPIASPLVSIGLPVYNGERFLSRAIDSFLGQTLSDFEVVISDNASTDRTQAICEDYAQRDRRVRYVRQPRNIGAPRNWNAAVHEARGTFFKWASANDYIAPDMLEKCVAAMQADPSIVLCSGKTQLVGDADEPGIIYQSDETIADARPSDRLAHLADVLTMNNLQCAVIRSDALRKTRLDRLYPSGDLSLMMELALYGKFLILPETMLFRYQSQETFTTLLPALERQRIHDPTAKSPLKLIRTRRHLDHLGSIARAPLPPMEKLRAFRVALRLARWDRSIIWREFRSLVAGADSTT